MTVVPPEVKATGEQARQAIPSKLRLLRPGGAASADSSDTDSEQTEGNQEGVTEAGPGN